MNKEIVKYDQSMNKYLVNIEGNINILLDFDSFF